MATNKLSPEQVALAREMRASGMTLQAVADEFGVTKQAIQLRCKDIVVTVHRRTDGICPRCEINSRGERTYCPECESEIKREKYERRIGRKAKRYHTKRKCKWCGKVRDTANVRALYCSQACQRSAQNHRYYTSKSALISKRNAERQRQARIAKRDNDE